MLLVKPSYVTDLKVRLFSCLGHEKIRIYVQEGSITAHLVPYIGRVRAFTMEEVLIKHIFHVGVFTKLVRVIKLGNYVETMMLSPINFLYKHSVFG